MPIPLRAAIGAVNAVLVVLVCAITLAATLSVSLSALESIGTKHAAALAETAVVRVGTYFSIPVHAADNLRNYSRSRNRGALLNDTDDSEVMRWDALVRQLFLHADLQLGGLNMYFEDGFRIAAIPAGYPDMYIMQNLLIAANGTMSRNYTWWWSDNLTQVDPSHPAYINDFSPPQDPRQNLLPLLRDSTFGGRVAGWDSNVRYSLITNVDVVVPQFYMTLAVPVHTLSGELHGFALVVQFLDRVNGFLSELGGTENTETFAYDAEGFLLASSHPTSVNSFETFPTGSTLPSGCVAEATDLLVASGNADEMPELQNVSCRAHASVFPYRPLNVAANTPGVAFPSDGSRPSDDWQTTRALTVDGQATHYVSCIYVPLQYQTSAMFILVALPDTDVIGDVLAGRNVAILLTAGIALLALTLGVAATMALLAPLDRIANRMTRAATLDDDDAMDEVSYFSEIRELQTSYYTLNTELRRIRAFVPQSLLQPHSHRESDEHEVNSDSEIYDAEVDGGSDYQESWSNASLPTNPPSGSGGTTSPGRGSSTKYSAGGSAKERRGSTTPARATTPVRMVVVPAGGMRRSGGGGGISRLDSSLGASGRGLLSSNRSPPALAGSASSSQIELPPRSSPSSASNRLEHTAGERVVLAMSGAGGMDEGPVEPEPARRLDSAEGDRRVRFTVPASLPSEVGLRPETITVLCCDLCGFHGACRALSHPQLAAMMERTVGFVFAVVSAQRGVLDRFNGDHFTATFNGARKCKNHPLRGVTAAHTIATTLARSREDSAGLPTPFLEHKAFRTDGPLPLHARIGVSTGRAVVGNVGTADFKTHNIIGPVVTNAVALVRLAKVYRRQGVLLCRRLASDMAVHYESLALDLASLPGGKRIDQEFVGQPPLGSSGGSSPSIPPRSTSASPRGGHPPPSARRHASPRGRSTNASVVRPNIIAEIIGVRDEASFANPSSGSSTPKHRGAAAGGSHSDDVSPILVGGAAEWMYAPRATDGSSPVPQQRKPRRHAGGSSGSNNSSSSAGGGGGTGPMPNIGVLRREGLDAWQRYAATRMALFNAVADGAANVLRHCLDLLKRLAPGALNARYGFPLVASRESGSGLPPAGGGHHHHNHPHAVHHHHHNNNNHHHPSQPVRGGSAPRAAEDEAEDDDVAEISYPGAVPDLDGSECANETPSLGLPALAGGSSGLLVRRHMSGSGSRSQPFGTTATAVTTTGQQPTLNTSFSRLSASSYVPEGTTGSGTMASSIASINTLPHPPPAGGPSAGRGLLPPDVDSNTVLLETLLFAEQSEFEDELLHRIPWYGSTVRHRKARYPVAPVPRASPPPEADDQQRPALPVPAISPSHDDFAPPALPLPRDAVWEIVATVESFVLRVPTAVLVAAEAQSASQPAASPDHATLNRVFQAVFTGLSG